MLQNHPSNSHIPLGVHNEMLRAPFPLCFPEDSASFTLQPERQLTRGDGKFLEGRVVLDVRSLEEWKVREVQVRVCGKLTTYTCQLLPRLRLTSCRSTINAHCNSKILWQRHIQIWAQGSDSSGGDQWRTFSFEWPAALPPDFMFTSHSDHKLRSLAFCRYSVDLVFIFERSDRESQTIKHIFPYLPTNGRIDKTLDVGQLKRWQGNWRTATISTSFKRHAKFLRLACLQPQLWVNITVSESYHRTGNGN